ncbi:MAG TPA: hypothetical protein VFH27_06050, partial [Longimicrobiaceae bacterium]|nr:hypothetical protein [Longimicrobiaceae bacterium]
MRLRRGGPPGRVVRRALLACVAAIALGASCAPPPTTPVDALAGEWKAEFHTGSLAMRWLPTGKVVTGEVTLGLDDRRCSPEDEVCGSPVRGNHTVAFRTIFGSSGADVPQVAGAVRPNGSVRIYLGGCCDWGAVSAEGWVV